MPDRSTETLVTFNHAFKLDDVIGARPAGVYRVVIDEDEVRGLSFLVYHRVATLLHVPAVGVPGPQQVFQVNSRDLDASLKADLHDRALP